MFKRFFGKQDQAEPEPEVEREVENTTEKGLEKTRRGWIDRLAEVFGAVDITDSTWDDLEARLIQADVGVQTAVDMVADLRERARFVAVRRADELPPLLRTVMVRTLQGVSAVTEAERAAGDPDGVPGATAQLSATAPLPAVTAPDPERPRPQPWIVFVIGVNGSGKTTTIAKLAQWHRQAGRKVVLVAADTFRAAAIEQLQRWGEKTGVPVIAGKAGGDPGAVVYDALRSNASKSADVVIIDTAGRLHTQFNLMSELVKIRNVVQRVVPDGPHETLLVLDAMTGQNGLRQAKAFADAVNVSGLGLAKLDSSAKGGVAFAVARELKLPILYIGTGERVEDFAVFDPVSYVNGVLGAVGR